MTDDVIIGRPHSVQCFSGVITSLLALYLPIEEVLGMGVFSILL